MALNQVQVDFTNNAGRVFMETLIRTVYSLEFYRDDYDAIQAGPDAFPVDGTILDDNKTGTAPRADAPVLVASDLLALRDIADNMMSQLSPAVRQALIGKMTRDLPTLLKLN